MDDERSRFDEHALEIAAFRHRVIADAVEADQGEVTAAVEAAAKTEYSAPDSIRWRPTIRTIWRWLSAYRKGGLFGLCPKTRADRGALRAFESALLERAVRLRREGKKEKRATRSIIDILVRQDKPNRVEIARSTLDRHLDRVLPASVHESGVRPSYGHEQEGGSWHDREKMRLQGV
jgi:putative transposase